MKRILVIGGTGFIGTNIISNLKKNGNFVGCYDLKNCNIGDSNYVGNITYDDNLDSIFSQYDSIVYLITSVSPKKSMEHPSEPYVNDIPLLIKTLDCARNNGINRIVFASSGGTVYGDNGEIKSKETDFNEPKNHYAICKLTSEKILEMYNKLYGMNNISLRISNPFGIGQNPNSNVGAITVFANSISKNQIINLYGDGGVVRDYIDVQEVAEAFRLAIYTDINNEEISPVFNIGSGQGISLKEIISIVSEVLDIEPIINYLPEREFDVKYNVLDIEKAKKYLNFNPSNDEKENIRNYVRKTFKK